MTRFPTVPFRRALGVGFDLPWGSPVGFSTGADGRDRVADRTIAFLHAHARRFSSLFVSWQPRDRARLDASAYFGAYDDLFARAPAFPVRALHHTALNLGALERYDRSGLIAFTNELIARYGFAWVNEDLGLWSLGGRPLPYPLPPYLTLAGVEAAVRATAEVQDALAVPLLVEFPGFTEGASFHVGTLDAYDVFREVIERTGSPCTLDTGHLLSWRWLQGHRGEALYDDLDRLPLDACFEIHLSGCGIVGGRFADFHHGVLLDEQIVMLSRLFARCPNVRVVTYEDPRFDQAGALVPKSVPNFERLGEEVSSWAA